MQVEDLLGPFEFVIFQDDSCHLACLLNQVGQQIKITPSILYVTNRRFIIITQFGSPEHHSLAFSEITDCVQRLINDCEIIIMKPTPPSQEVWLHIPDAEQQTTLARIFSVLIAASEVGEAKIDSVALKMQEIFKTYPSVTEFYKHFDQVKAKLENTPEQQKAQAVAILSSLSSVPDQLFDIIGDAINVSETLMFAIVLLTVASFSILFSLIPFGICVCAVATVFIARHGVKILLNKSATDKETIGFGERLARRFSSFYSSYIKFRKSFRNRVLWSDPKLTLEVVAFLATTALMFCCFDCSVILFISAFGLGFIERWNPFGFGSLSELFGNLFSF